MLTLNPESWSALAAEEVRQLIEEGHEPEAVAALSARCRDTESFGEQLWQEGPQLPLREDWPHVEPSDWEGIVAARTVEVRTLTVDPRRLLDRIHGAWLGRCAGCMLGKPVEGRTREEIRAILEAEGEYPLGGYFPRLAAAPEGISYPAADSPLLRGNIVCSERDDDTDYTVLGLTIWRERGPEFTPADVAAAWLSQLPFHKVYTAERAAYRNLVNEIPPPASALAFNPYREWIGAQIRADAWGYVVPGQPALAAEFAFRDACISHTKNGIYGEMFFGALIAASLASSDLRVALDAARATTPPKSRFAEMVQDCVEWCAADSDWEVTRDRVQAKYGSYHWVHTLNNAALVLIALLHADGDFTRAIGLAVQGGWDTDCNGATAGSVMGALLGVKAIPASWSEPLNDILLSAVNGYERNSIAELARRTMEAEEYGQ